MIVEQSLSAEAMALALQIKPSSLNKQIERMYTKLNKPPCPDPPVRTRAALVNRVWVEYWLMREQERTKQGN